MFLQNKRVDAGTGQQQSQHHAGRTAARDAAPHRHRLSTHIDLDLEERERTEGRLLVAEELYKKFWQKTRYEGFESSSQSNDLETRWDSFLAHPFTLIPKSVRTLPGMATRATDWSVAHTQADYDIRGLSGVSNCVEHSKG
jgi:hypothetical protein